MASCPRVRVRTALSRSGLPDLDYSLNPYVGCQHGCVYCYAREYTRYREVADRWGSLVYVKENLLSLLESETKRLKPGTVGLSTVTDPYQPVESVLKLTRRSIEILLKRGFKVSIQTKSPLVLRDLDILATNKDSVDVGFTIITLDPRVASLLEPGAPPPAGRAEALRRISERGVRTWLFYGPVIPGFNDDSESFAGVLEAVAGGIDLVLVDKLRITPRVRASLSSTIEDIGRIETAVRSGAWWSGVVEEFEKVCARLGVRCLASLAEPSGAAMKDLERFASGR